MLEMTTQTNPTAISVEAKARLAKLLATENITVEHRNVPTAMFDIKDRVLILPNWKDITKDIYDLLVLHEVGHALFTPLDGWHGAVSAKGPNYKGFLNITEDARIEKKQKRKFPGGRRSMIAGYKELLARDFFGIKDRDIATFGLIDRLNIHFKAGIAASVPFSAEEMVWVERMAALETFDDAEALADDLFDEMKSDMPETDTGRGIEGDGEIGIGEPAEEGEGEATEGFGVPVPDDNGDDSDDSEMGDESPFGDDEADGESDTDGDAPSGDGDGMEDADNDSESAGDGSENGEANEADKADGDSDSTDKGDSDSDPSDDSDDEGEAEAASGDQAGRGGNTSTGAEPFSETDEAFRNKEVTLVDDNDITAPTYVQIPKDEAFDLDAIIIPNKEVIRALKQSAVEYNPKALMTAAKQVKAYRTKNAKVVNYLAKEFEMRKAADASKRTTVSKTGILDTNTLHSFKWNDDIFKKVANVADGKSHGLQLFVDWSGSMGPNMFGTLDQVLNLVLFCKKVGIPFDVYAFTDGYERSFYYNSQEPRRKDRMVKSKLETGDLEFRKDNFNLLQIATSQGNRAAFNDMMMGLIILRGNFNHNGKWANDEDSDVSYYNIDPRYGLCGTPLNEAIMSSIPVINRFREANGLQIVNSVFLTDGAGSDIYRAHGIERMGRYGGSIIIRDRKSRKEFVQNTDRFRPTSGSQLPILLEMVRIRTGAKIVNFYVTNPSAHGFKSEWMASVPNVEDAGGYMNDDEEGSRAAYKVAKADGGVALENSIHGWDHHYLILGGDELGVHGDEGLDDSLVGAKKGKLKAAFGKAASGKLKNRVVLRKFTDLIAA